MAREDAKAGQDAIDRDAWYESRQTIIERCPKKHKRAYRVHPSIGIARVGNSPDQYFLGPENDASLVPSRFFTLPEDPTEMPYETQIAALAERTYFKDRPSDLGKPEGDLGRIRRQAARFRVFEYMTCKPGRGKKPAWKWTREITSDEAEITWSVEVANKKAAFFKVTGSGLGAKRGGSQKPTIEPGKKKLKVRRGFDPKKHPMTRVALEDKGKPIEYLGEILHDEKGRLVFLGGRGLSKGPAPATDAFNNDDWVDDVSDGEINAALKFPKDKGKTYDTKKIDGNAWVIVGPPDFGPEITNVVSLYDLMMDLSVKESVVPTDDNQIIFDMHGVTDRKDMLYNPHFDHDLLRLLLATVETATVFAPANPRMKHPAVYKLAANTHIDDAKETQASIDAGIAPNAHLRYKIFNTLRPPDGDKEPVEDPPDKPVSTDPKVQEAALKRYEQYRRSMPYQPADDGSDGFPVTQLQYDICRMWYWGAFKDTTFQTFDGIPRSTSITPAGLDRAALDHTVGGPFYPGIEVSWLSRSPEIYVDPFRVKRGNAPKEITYYKFKSRGVEAAGLKVEPGFFTQQMAQPWQTDFYDCGGGTYAWWPGNRPVHVLRGALGTSDPAKLLDPIPVKRQGQEVQAVQPDGTPVFKLDGMDALLARPRNITITVGGQKPHYAPKRAYVTGQPDSNSMVKLKDRPIDLAPGTNAGSDVFSIVEKVRFDPATIPAEIDAKLAVGFAGTGKLPEDPVGLCALTPLKSAGGEMPLLAGGNTALGAAARRLLFTLDGSETDLAPLTVTVKGTDEDGDDQTEVVALPGGPGTEKSEKKFGSVERITYPPAMFEEDLPATVSIGTGEFVGDMVEWEAGVKSEDDMVSKWWRLGFVVKGVEIERDPNLDVPP